MDDVTVPEQRSDRPPTWLSEPLWTTTQACLYVAAVRGIEPESARRWLGRNVAAVDRQPGREGENRYRASVVRYRATPGGLPVG